MLKRVAKYKYMQKVTPTGPLITKSYTYSLKYLENGEKQEKEIIHFLTIQNLCILYLTRVRVHSFEPYLFGPLNILCKNMY